MNEKQDQFGEQEVCTVINRYRHLPARELQAGMIEAARQFRGAAEQHDDITIVVVKSNR